jgi:HK97 family phage major capsid protein
MNAAENDELTQIIRTTAREVRAFRERQEDRLDEIEARMRGLENHLPASGYLPQPDEGGPVPPAAPREPGGDLRAGLWLHGSLAAVSGGSGAGDALTPPEYAGYFFDLLAAQSVALRSGIRILRTENDSLVVPRLLADQTAYWVSEGSPITDSDPNADTMTATPRKCAALTAISNEVIDDSTPEVLQTFGMQIVRSLALAFDLGVFQGSGTPPQIRGLRATTGIQDIFMGDNGAAPSNLDEYAEAIGKLEQENAEAGAVVMHPRTWGDLLQLKEQTTGSNKPLLQESAGSGSQGIERRIYGVPVYLSSQLATNEVKGTSGSVCSSAYVYEPDQLVAVIRKETQVTVDSSRLFNSDQSEMKAIMRADLLVPNPKAVVRISGILAAA